MLDFSPILLSDRDRIHRALCAYEGYGCECSFVNLFLWGDQKVAFVDDMPVFLGQFYGVRSYPYPAMHPRFPEILDILRQDARERGIALRFFGLREKDVAFLNTRYPGQFVCTPLRDTFDYLYEIDRLCELRGKKLQAKRNHCNRFEAEHPDYRVVPISRENLPRCSSFVDRWFGEHVHPEGESRAVYAALAHFEELRLEGIFIEVAEEIVAFTMGNCIRESTFNVNFEKALGSVNGAYAVVNRDFARRIRARYPGVRYLNREDDAGEAGLRRAKESYRPDILLEKYAAVEVSP
ncbi:MAG: phosphatidylglycerol lysyltransferase domain-containing protein [Oscillospiraceae bacterium]|nr:phosphatidylglycerol lysyltransferase domain-containing protein [Oscillospiraceae bacterium]